VSKIRGSDTFTIFQTNVLGPLWYELNQNKSYAIYHPLISSLQDRAVDKTVIPGKAKVLLRQWLEGINLTETITIHGGKAFPPLLRRRVFISERNLKYDCVFFAVPYFMLGKALGPMTGARDDVDYHPTRALVQSLYRSDSPFSREKSQAIRTVWAELGEDELVFAPQLWGLTVGNSNESSLTSYQLCDPKLIVPRLPLNLWPKPTRKSLDEPCRSISFE
jgi:hypothetical protein